MKGHCQCERAWKLDLWPQVKYLNIFKNPFLLLKIFVLAAKHHSPLKIHRTSAFYIEKAAKLNFYLLCFIY